jgi:energy-coupling factor transporter ATP-binding protein EcfA2
VFVELEVAAAETATYRGKVLSLERERHERKTGASVTVHRLAPVAREDVVLPAETLTLLERNVFGFVAQRAALKAMGLPVKKGLLFHGPPGTGKTHTIRYLAGALPRHTTLLVTAAQVGHIDQYMTLGRLLSPAIVVIEDADLIARQREEMATPGQEVLLNQLLNEMDGLRDDAEILFILTTNRPEALEAALTDRPGRIDQAIAFPLPDAEGRRKLARLYGRGAPIPADALEHVVGRTEGVSAAFIRELMRRAAQYALERGAQDVEIAVADVEAALNELLFQGGRLNAALLGRSRRNDRPEHRYAVSFLGRRLRAGSSTGRASGCSGTSFSASRRRSASSRATFCRRCSSRRIWPAGASR